VTVKGFIGFAGQERRGWSRFSGRESDETAQ
jgi:hypothetical protein